MKKKITSIVTAVILCTVITTTPFMAAEADGNGTNDNFRNESVGLRKSER